MGTLLLNFQDSYKKAVELVEKNRIKEALITLEKVELIYNKNIYVINLIGLCNYLHCNFDNAIRFWEEGIKLKDNKDGREYLNHINSKEFKRIRYLYKESINYIEKKQYNEAINTLNTIVNSESELIEPYKLLYIANYLNNNKEEAFINIEKALELDSSDSDTIIYYKNLAEEIINKYNKTMRPMFIVILVLIAIIFILIWKLYQ